jgi:choline dehydrogenase-like flavoprotein
MFRAAGHPFVLTRAFDRRTPSHQCGTVRMGIDPATAAAINPSLTFAAQALCVADHILQDCRRCGARRGQVSSMTA